jgi:DNA-binding CsgD family transcriptional regulator
LTLNELRNTKSKELISKIATRMKESAGEERSPELNKLITELKASYSDKSWAEFELRFKQIHGNFYEKLIEKYPNLTMNERRLSAFLKLQMTTKEIAGLTGQSPRSIELARTRLRKKLGLTNSEHNLYDFFLGF